MKTKSTNLVDDCGTDASIAKTTADEKKFNLK